MKGLQKRIAQYQIKEQKSMIPWYTVKERNEKEGTRILPSREL